MQLDGMKRSRQRDSNFRNKKNAKPTRLITITQKKKLLSKKDGVRASFVRRSDHLCHFLMEAA